MRDRLRTVSSWLDRHPWTMPAVAALALWLLASVISGSVSVNLLLANATLAGFLALAAVGQMVVISSGDGSFDLSVPYVIVASAFVAVAVTNGHNGLVVWAILACLGTGVLMGVINGLLVAGPKIPPVVATLATSYILYSGILELEGHSSGALAPALVSFTHKSTHDASLALVPVLLLIGLVTVLVNRTSYGQYLRAMGQNRRAAALAGVRVGRMIVANFVVSGVLGSLLGILLAGFDGGAFTTMGDAYLLGSVAAVVVGGVPVSGGVVSTTSVMFGALVMTLLITVLEISKLAVGAQDLIEGVTIVAMVLLTSRRARVRV